MGPGAFAHDTCLVCVGPGRIPSNYAEKVRIEFSRQHVQDAFIPLIRELRAFAL
jgi:hypothetical protein